MGSETELSKVQGPVLQNLQNPPLERSIVLRIG
ncbi:BnaC09g41300D [Brassica napus]|uniref:BnaC09g41300D protein n=1 Tax=Brassica napus TaxID=3708 RepID=A0A078II82_BRANA|nr:BnaC09g41300D [Brassica napus]